MMEPNTGYRPVKLDGMDPPSWEPGLGWRPSWHTIVSGRFAESLYDALLFYDAAGGTVEFYSSDGLGNIALLQSHTGRRASWSQIVPGRYEDSGFSGLLFYDKAAGHGEFCSTDGVGNLTPLQPHDDWRTSWDRIVPIADHGGLTRLLFYDRGST
jgi:hypothetical protein